MALAGCAAPWIAQGAHASADRPGQPAAVHPVRDRLGPGFLRVESRFFTVYSDVRPSVAADHAGALDDAAFEFLETLRAMGADLHDPRHKPVIVLFSEHADFVRFAREVDGVDATWMGGYFHAGQNRVIAYDDLRSPAFQDALRAAPDEAGRAAVRAQAAAATRDKLVHEAAHAMAFATGLQRPGVRYPAWLSEGLAEFFARGGEHGAHGPGPACVSDLTLERPPTSCADRTDAFYAQSGALFARLARESPAELIALFRDVADAQSHASQEAVAARFAERFRDRLEPGAAGSALTSVPTE